jgi:hypothetical protein
MSHCYNPALDWTTTICFLLFHATRFPLKNVQYLVVDLLSEGDHTQSASVKPSTWRCPFFIYNILRPGAFLQISNNTNDSIQMNDSRCFQKLAHNANCISNIWFGDGKIVQLSDAKEKEKEYGLLQGSRDLQDSKKFLSLIIIQHDILFIRVIPK